MPRSIIIDTDPGIDDAVAILLALASPQLEVLGLTVVAGNLALAPLVGNALAVAELAGRADLPVYAGCPRPMGEVQQNAAAAHGEGGLGDLIPPPASRAPHAAHAVTYLIETLRGAAPGGITLCALGPLTNIAVALIMAPEVAPAIAELVIMGGGSRGNVTPAAEFNLHADPVAASLVFAAGVPITLVPLDVTETVKSTPERVAAIRRVGTRCALAVADLLSPGPPGDKGAPVRPAMAMHDPCVIAYVLAPELFAGAAANVTIEIAGDFTRGMSVIDWRGRTARPANARVLQTVDAAGIYQLLAERVANLP
ncbi:MAG: nucleoside hydrolase [Alphaproteobacteria bacterium]|nr:nucleoside hydrolase [Alphaproteobacteria bacterium]